MEWHKELWKILKESDYLDMLPAYLNYLEKIGVRWLIKSGNRIPENTSYSRKAFNRYGDISYRLPDEHYEFTKTSVTVP